MAFGGCRNAGQIILPLEAEEVVATPPAPESTITALPLPTSATTMPGATPPAEPTAAASPVAEPTPVYSGVLSPACGQFLPAIPPVAAAQTTSLNVDSSVRAELQARAPAAAWPALARLLDEPGAVGLVAYRLGQDGAGAYLNADVAMPLASAAKLVHLVAYAEAVAAGELDPLEPIALDELDRYYLPNFDLGAHRRAVNELRENGRLIGEDDSAVLLEDVPWMMIRHSSNAASDYLQTRLGQARIEQTAIDLGLSSHSAPCLFLGQFLMMGNHTRGAAADTAALRQYVEGQSTTYGADLSLLADAYTNSAIFREREVAWRTQTRRPPIAAQRYFSEHLNTQGSAREYAALMARLAQNGLSTPESSYLARTYLEWPMQFPVNQELFSNLGYKNGSLPGVLTTVYYAYRWDDLTAPIILALFYRDLPQQTYRQWRRQLPHDELARWLLSDPEAIPLLNSVLP